MNDTNKYISDARKVAEFRLMVLGDVLALPIGHGDKLKKLKEQAKKEWSHPDGHVGPIGLRTLQRWLTKAQNARDRVEALLPMERKDKGKLPSVSTQQRELLRKYWQERPENLWKNHYRNLVAENKETLPSFSSVKRFLRSENLYRIPKDGDKENKEKLSFEVPFVNQVWHLDCHHGSCRVVDEAGQWKVAKLIVFIDDKSRFICHAQWYLNECCREMCSAFEQAALKSGLPHRVYTDNGSGMRGSEFGEGLLRLGVILNFTAVKSPYQNGKLERFWGTMESQLLQMVPKDKPMTLPELNRYTQAWLHKDYHLVKHSEIKTSPQKSFLNDPAVPIRRPNLAELRAAFRKSVPRHTRSQDGTIQIEGVRFQLPASYRHISNVMVRYASWNLGVAELVDSRTRNTIAEIYPLDKQTNSHRAREPVLEPQRPQPSETPPGISPYLDKLCREIDAETNIPNFNPTIPIKEEVIYS